MGYISSKPGVIVTQPERVIEFVRFVNFLLKLVYDSSSYNNGFNKFLFENAVSN